jgi:hypothetical protein
MGAFELCIASLLGDHEYSHYIYDFMNPAQIRITNNIAQLSIRATSSNGCFNIRFHNTRFVCVQCSITRAEVQLLLIIKQPQSCSLRATRQKLAPASFFAVLMGTIKNFALVYWPCHMAAVTSESSFVISSGSLGMRELFRSCNFIGI